MNSLTKFNTIRDISVRTSDWLVSSIIPWGWFALLTGIFWIWDRSNYHKLFYATLATPTFIALIANPQQLKAVARNPLVIRFLLFAAYITTSVLWSGTDNPLFIVAFRPAYIVMVLFAALLISQQQPGRLERMTELAGVASVICAVASLGYYFHSGTSERFSGYGALYNPLLSAHVFGFYCAYWLSRWHLSDKALPMLPIAALIILWALLVLTGSRTPLVAIVACLLWLAIARWRKRLWWVVIPALGLALAAHTYLPASNLLERGMSFRPAIWMEALKQVQASPWLGLGLSHTIIIYVDGLDYALADTHNILLGVLFDGGIVGLALWLAIYVWALLYSWKQRHDSSVLIASTLVVFGFVAGLTEGSAFLSRPKEHWFLIWIPLALLAATKKGSAPK